MLRLELIRADGTPSYEVAMPDINCNGRWWIIDKRSGFVLLERSRAQFLEIWRAVRSSGGDFVRISE